MARTALPAGLPVVCVMHRRRVVREKEREAALGWTFLCLQEGLAVFSFHLSARPRSPIILSSSRSFTAFAFAFKLSVVGYVGFKVLPWSTPSYERRAAFSGLVGRRRASPANGSIKHHQSARLDRMAGLRFRRREEGRGPCPTSDEEESVASAGPLPLLVRSNYVIIVAEPKKEDDIVAADPIRSFTAASCHQIQIRASSIELIEAYIRPPMHSLLIPTWPSPQSFHSSPLPKVPAVSSPCCRVPIIRVPFDVATHTCVS